MGDTSVARPSQAAESVEHERARLAAHVTEVHTVLGLNAAACLLVLGYAGLTLDRPNRLAMAAVASLTLVYLGCIALLGPARAARLRVGAGALVSYAISIIVVSGWVFLDGGAASPLNATYLLPLALAASSAPRAAALLTSMAVGGHVAAVLLVGELAPAAMLVWVTQFVLVAAAAAWIGRIRLGQSRRLRELAAELQELATLDPLTRTLNRRGLETVLAAAQEGFDPDAPSALLVVDLDHFKRVNDTHGHQVGDVVLVAAAAAISATVREGDLVTRLGGEEFLVLLRDADDATALAVAERVRAAIAACSTDIPITASVGLATAKQRQVASGLDAVLARADSAMYAAKAGGRNRVATAGRPSEAVHAEVR